MSVLLPDDLARDLGVMLEAGWFVASLQKPMMKTGKMFLVNATKDPSWTLLLTYDPNDRTQVDPLVELYRNETEYTDLDRAGLLRAIVQPDAIEGPWKSYDVAEEEFDPPLAEPVLGGYWGIAYVISNDLAAKTQFGYASREEALRGVALALATGIDVTQILRPDGIVELEGRELRTAAYAYEANRERNG